MLSCIDKINFALLDFERNMFYHVVEKYNGELQHKNVISASQRMDQIINNWYKNQKKKP
jgi:hypothetical protein